MISPGNPSFAEDACADWSTESFFSAASPADVRHCLASGSSVNDRDPDGRTPLHIAASVATDATIIVELLSAGADPTLADTDGRRPIHDAAASARAPEALAYLLLWGSEIDRELPNGKRCPWSTARCATLPLHLAGKRTDGAPFLAALLTAGANPNARDMEGRSALQHAAEIAPDTLMVRILLEAGASVDVADFKGFTPLHAAARRADGAQAIIEALIDAGASVDQGDENKTTPLMWGARSAPNSTILHILIEASDDPCVSDKQERNALRQWDMNSNLDRDEVYWALHDQCIQ